MLQRQFEVHDVAVLSGVYTQRLIELNRALIPIAVVMGSVRSQRGRLQEPGSGKLIFKSDKQHLMCYTRKHLLKKNTLV
jgi:hypothetical protein